MSAQLNVRWNGPGCGFSARWEDFDEFMQDSQVYEQEYQHELKQFEDLEDYNSEIRNG